MTVLMIASFNAWRKSKQHEHTGLFSNQLYLDLLSAPSVVKGRNMSQWKSPSVTVFWCFGVFLSWRCCWALFKQEASSRSHQRCQTLQSCTHSAASEMKHQLCAHCTHIQLLLMFLYELNSVCLCTLKARTVRMMSPMETPLSASLAFAQNYSQKNSRRVMWHLNGRTHRSY